MDANDDVVDVNGAWPVVLVVLSMDSDAWTGDTLELSFSLRMEMATGPRFSSTPNQFW